MTVVKLIPLERAGRRADCSQRGILNKKGERDEDFSTERKSA